MQNLFEPEQEQEQASLHQVICSLILGADHPITANEIQSILEAVAEDDFNEAQDALKEVTDADLEAVQEEADHRNEGGAEPPAEQAAEKPESEKKTRAAAAQAVRGSVPSMAEIKKAIAELQGKFRELGIGVGIAEVSGGYRFMTSSDCGKWVRKMLNKGKPTRLSRPTIETLAIIAYRQPVARSEIESIRGVSAGHVIKALMEMQLVRIIGRSDLPGRPFLFGTTPAFLDHFGLKSLKDLEPIGK